MNSNAPVSSLSLEDYTSLTALLGKGKATCQPVSDPASSHYVKGRDLASLLNIHGLTDGSRKKGVRACLCACLRACVHSRKRAGPA